jgi:hypothetical protein
MNVFVSALNAIAPHFRVRGHTLLISQGDLFSRTGIDLRQVAAHNLPGMITLHLRLFRGRWQQYSMEGFRSREVARLCTLLTRWEKQNHQKHEPEA